MCDKTQNQNETASVTFWWCQIFLRPILRFFGTKFFLGLITRPISVLNSFKKQQFKLQLQLLFLRKRYTFEKYWNDIGKLANWDNCSTAASTDVSFPWHLHSANRISSFRWLIHQSSNNCVLFDNVKVSYFLIFHIFFSWFLVISLQSIEASPTGELHLRSLRGCTQDLYLLQPTYFPYIFWAWYVGKLLLWKGRYMIIHTPWLKRMNWPSIQILPLFLFPDLYLMSDIRAGFRPISSTYSEHISTKSKQSRFFSPHFPHFEAPKEMCHMILGNNTKLRQWKGTQKELFIG